MIVFVSIILILYLYSWDVRPTYSFGRDKVVVLKCILSLFIVAHHLQLYRGIMPMFHSWGAPIVSMFLFISGYGLITQYELKGESYLSSFISQRIGKALLLPFLLAVSINLIAFGNASLPNSWFVFAILYGYFSFYVLAKYVKRAVVLNLFLLCLLYVFVIKGLGFDRCWYISIMAFPFGLYYKMKEEKIKVLWSSPIRYYLTVPLSLCALALCVKSANEYLFLLCYILIPFIGANLWTRINIEKCGNVIVSFLAGISYEIYLVHGLVMNLIHDYISSNVLFVIFTYLLTILLAYCLNRMKQVLLAIRK